MKRILLCLTLLLLLSASTATGEAPPFLPGETHASTPAFAQYFKTMSAPLGNCTVSIAERVYDPGQAEALLALIRSDLRAIAAHTGIPASDLQAHSVYIVERLVNGSIERHADRVYCRAQDVESGAYRPLLVCAALGTEEYWIGTGLADCIWGKGADAASLREYFAATDDLSLLSLAVPFFIDDFAPDEEIALARQTASALCAFALEHGGVDALLTGDGAALRQAWLHAIGVDRPYDDPRSAALASYRYRASATCSLIAEDSLGNTVYIAPMADVVTADDLCWFLHDLLAGPKAFLSQVEAQAPEYATSLRGRWGKLRIYCGQDGSWAVPEYREIRLALGSGFMHELGHILVPAAGANFYSTMWQYEGLCYFMGYEAYPMHALKEQYHQALHLFSGMTAPETPNHRFSKLAVTLYLLGTPLPDGPAAVEASRYAHAMALVPLRFPDAAPDSSWAATIHDSYPALRSAGGNELTEYQAYSFTAYLIRQHGLSAFLRFCVEGLPFAEVFGAPYETLRADWIAALETAYK